MGKSMLKALLILGCNVPLCLCAAPPQTSVRNANSGANETTLLRARITYITSSLFNDNIPSSSLLEHNVDQPHLLLTKTSNGKGESSFWCCCHPPAHHLLELNGVECETLKEWSGSQERDGVEISKKRWSQSLEWKSEPWAIVSLISFTGAHCRPHLEQKTEILLPDLYFCFARSVQYTWSVPGPRSPTPKAWNIFPVKFLFLLPPGDCLQHPKINLLNME